MPDEKPSFKELLDAAPLATKEDSVTLTGALERSRHPEKFVLVLENGRSVVLDVSAVKDCRVIAGMIGQKLVQIDVARDQVPREIGENSPTDLARFHKPPHLEKYSWEEPIRTHYADIRPNPYPEFDPYSAGYYGMVPFALATRHQAPGEAIAAMAAPSVIRKPPHLEGGTFPGHPTSDV